MYDKTKGTLHLNKIASPRKHTVDKPTTYTRPAVLHSNPALAFSFLGPPYSLQSFHYSSGKNSSIIPFFKRNQEKPNKKFESWFCHPPQVWFYEDTKIPTLQMNQMLSIGVSSCMYNGWSRITASEKARICDLRLNWYSHTRKPMNMVWKFSIKTEFSPKLAF